MGAVILSTPELELDKEESAKLADAMAEIARLKAVAVSPMTLAVVNLCAACGFVYGPRIAAYRLRKKRLEAAAPPKLAAMPEPRPAPRAAAPAPAPAKPANGSPAPPQYSPSDLYPEPAADFPGMG